MAQAGGAAEPAAAQLPRAASALPAYFELQVQPAWQAIDFISDLHLCEAMPRTFDAWSAHLRHTPADAVFLLGDLFEVWVGDDMRQLAFERRCVDVLAQAASRRQLAFMAGNRDFLVGTGLLRECGVMALPDPTVLHGWGQRVLLSHGDALCLDDLPYQAFRREVRSARWQIDFLAKPLAERLAIARDIRRASASRPRFDGNADVDVDPAEAVRWMHALGAAELVHGHTHRPGSELLAPGFKRHVLSDWDLDTGQRAEVLRLGRDGFTRVAPATAASGR
jgi:UDP-2,3-diacylglucosamine hydrolase